MVKPLKIPSLLLYALPVPLTTKLTLGVMSDVLNLGTVNLDILLEIVQHGLSPLDLLNLRLVCLPGMVGCGRYD